MLLPLTGCMVAGAGPGAAPTGAGTSSVSPTPSAPPPAVYSLMQLRAMVGSVHAIDGPAASVLKDAQFREIQRIQLLASSRATSDPAECLDLLRNGSLLDDRIPAAAALVGPIATASMITVSSDDSGLYWRSMYSLDQARAHCSPTTLALDGQTARVELFPVIADLHGKKTIASVQKITDQNGPHYTLSMIAMSGNLFVTGKKKIPAAQPAEAAIRELSGYINTVIDGAANGIPAVSATAAGV